jgi:hypothetical protein
VNFPLFLVPGKFGKFGKFDSPLIPHDPSPITQTADNRAPRGTIIAS